MSTRERGRDDRELRSLRGNYSGKNMGLWSALDVPRCSVYRAAALNIATATTTPISWDTLDYDTDSMTAVNATTGTLITCKTQGVYAVVAWLTWASSAASFRQIQLAKISAGVTTTYGDLVSSPGTGTITGQNITAHIPLIAGDTVSLNVGQSTGGNLAIIAATATGRENGLQACLISTS